jgi:hypothetical protein
LIPDATVLQQPVAEMHDNTAVFAHPILLSAWANNRAGMTTPASCPPAPSDHQMECADEVVLSVNIAWICR